MNFDEISHEYKFLLHSALKKALKLKSPTTDRPAVQRNICEFSLGKPIMICERIDFALQLSMATRLLHFSSFAGDREKQAFTSNSGMFEPMCC